MLEVQIKPNNIYVSKNNETKNNETKAYSTEPLRSVVEKLNEIWWSDRSDDHLDDEPDISALNILVGRIHKAWPHPVDKNSYCMEVDIGQKYGIRQVASRLKPFYQINDLQGKLVLIVENWAPRTMRGFMTHGLVLSARSGCGENLRVEIISPLEGCTPGERVEFDGVTGEPEHERKLFKKNTYMKLSADLLTTEKGVLVWKDFQARTSAGVVKGLMPSSEVR